MQKTEQAALSDIKKAILDAAETHMRVGGYGGFSFRDLATEVGIKSSSVHYHFPTKEDLGAAVIRRWTERLEKKIDREIHADPDPVRVWTKTLRGLAQSDLPMCPCTVLAASSRDLPDAVAAQVKSFFKMCQDKMTAQGLSPVEAAELFSTLIGAMVVANAMREPAVFDQATNARQTATARAPSRRAKPAAARSGL